MADPAPTLLAPGFLVASPALRDPNFSGSLVLMGRHEAEGSLGWVVNRPAPVETREILASVDEGLAAAARAAGRDRAPVLLGGPVQTERLWILFRPGAVPPGDEELGIGDRLAAGGSRQLLERLARDPQAGEFQLVLGYAGWGPLQVEHEVAAGAWVPLSLHEDLVFEVPLAARWEESVRRLGLDPAGFALGGGSGQA